MSCSVITRDIGGLKAGFEASTARPTCGRAAPGLRPGRDRRGLCSPCSASTWPMRSREPSLQSAINDALAVRLQRADMLGHGLEHIGAGLVRARRRNCGPAARRRRSTRSRPLAAVRARRTASAAPAAIVRGARAIRLRRDRAGPAAAACTARRRRHRASACLRASIIVGDLLEPLCAASSRQRLEHDRACRADSRTACPAGVEQRQPMLHAGDAAAFAHRFVERIVRRRRAERRDIAGAEAPDRVAGELELGDRHEIERAQLGRWCAGVSGSKLRMDSSVSPKKSSRTGSSMPGANRSTMPPRTAYSPASRTVAARLKPLSSSQLRDARHRRAFAGRDRERLRRDEPARRHALQARR